MFDPWGLKEQPMMKTFLVLPLLVASGLLAAPEVNALTLDNGRNLNGGSLNGGSLNGRNINGRNMNGTAHHGATEASVAAKPVSVILKDGEHITLK